MPPASGTASTSPVSATAGRRSGRPTPGSPRSGWPATRAVDRPLEVRRSPARASRTSARSERASSAWTPVDAVEGAGRWSSSGGARRAGRPSGHSRGASTTRWACSRLRDLRLRTDQVLPGIDQQAELGRAVGETDRWQVGFAERSPGRWPGRRPDRSCRRRRAATFAPAEMGRHLAHGMTGRDEMIGRPGRRSEAEPSIPMVAPDATASTQATSSTKPVRVQSKVSLRERPPRHRRRAQAARRLLVGIDPDRCHG